MKSSRIYHVIKTKSIIQRKIFLLRRIKLQENDINSINSININSIRNFFFTFNLVPTFI